MSAAANLPRAAAPFVSFAALLRSNGFAVAPEQTTAFLSAVALLGPRSILDIRRAAHATLAPQPERREAFDALFDAHFLSSTALTLERETAEDEEEIRAAEGERGAFDPPLAARVNEAGQASTAAEVLSVRAFTGRDEAQALRHFARALPERLPRRLGHRRQRSNRGPIGDLRRTLREAMRTEGEVFTLPRLRRRPRQRRVLLMIDVSGSMKSRTEAHLRFAHVLARAVERIEVFTLGTRLTRVTRALGLRNPEQALAAASGVVADWDGGTRLGDGLMAFLGVPRFAGYARGAVVLILSDGLERGDPSALAGAVARLAGRAWRVSWLTPLAADPRFRVETQALRAILPYVDHLADGGSTAALCAHVLSLAKDGAGDRPGRRAA